MGTLVQVCAADAVEFGRQPLLGRHELRRSTLFEDAALIELLDRFPRERLYAMTMGTDPERPEDNRIAINRGVSGADLLRAVQKGRLWLNVTRVDRVDPRYRALIDDLYGSLAAQLPDFEPQVTQGTLLISSPRALVYYHVDGPASVLWHIRGRKRIWIYPALDERFVEREALEDIFAGARHEYLPFKSAFDRAAWVSDLEPGEWLAWAQNAPHRVMNLDSVNVSLATEHFTAQTRARARLYAANQYLRTQLGMRHLSTEPTGAAAAAKQAVHWLARKAHLASVSNGKRHIPSLRVDPEAEGGVAALEPEFVGTLGGMAGT